MIIFKYLSRIFIVVFTIVLGYFKKNKTRKPKSDVPTFSHKIFNIDPKITISAIEIIPIDTQLDFYKTQILVGIRINGHIDQTTSGAVFKGIHQVYFYENDQTNPFSLSIEIVPVLQTQYLASATQQPPAANYTFSNNKAQFDVYVEEIINIHTFGPIEITWKCGNAIQKIKLFRYK